MSFRCQGCKKSFPELASPKKVVTKKRERDYLNRGNYSQGWEIVEELSVCKSCAELAIPPVLVETKRLERPVEEMDFGYEDEEDVTPLRRRMAL